MIINNALRNKNQKNVWQQWKGQIRLWAVCVASERTRQDCVFWSYLRQQDLINSGKIWLFLPYGRNQVKSRELQLKSIPDSKDGVLARTVQFLPQLQPYYRTNSLPPLSIPSSFFPFPRLLIILYFKGVKKRMRRHRLARMEALWSRHSSSQKCLW